MNDIKGPTGGGSADHRFPTLAEPKQTEPELTWRDWLLIGGIGLTLALVAASIVYCLALLLLWLASAQF